MPLPNLDVPQFPNVPIALGVPPVLRGPLNDAAQTIAALFSDGPSILANQAAAQWGIFDQNGQPVIVGDSCIAFDYAKDFRISDYPQEEGAFASYNKVEEPFVVKFSIAKKGSKSDVADFIVEVGAAENSTDLYNGITRNASFDNISIDHIDYRQTASAGAAMVTMDIWCKQIRITATASLTQTAAPSGQDANNDGPVQAQTPTASQTASALEFF